MEAFERRRSRPKGGEGDAVTGLRFAFYGRMSTEEYQDRVTSLSWQREVADELVAGEGAVVAEFFDGVSRGGCRGGSGLLRLRCWRR
nr:Site-specific recombinase [Kibdelosporangium sp. MJ126-NF4]